MLSLFVSFKYSCGKHFPSPFITEKGDKQGDNYKRGESQKLCEKIVKIIENRKKKGRSGGEKGMNRINNYLVVFYIVINQEKEKKTKIMFTWDPWTFPGFFLFPLVSISILM